MVSIVCNVAAVFFGGIIGTLAANHISDTLKKALPLIFAQCTMAMSVGSISATQSLTVVIAAMLLGSVLGTIIDLESNIQKSGRWFACRLNKNDLSTQRESYLEQFTIAVILFCAISTGVYGAMQAAIAGNQEFLMNKSLLDFFTAIIFASSIGFIVSLLCISMFACLGLVYAGAGFVAPFINTAMFSDFCGCGGVILLATGLRMAGIKAFPVANMLPALLLVMPVSYVWGLF